MASASAKLGDIGGWELVALTVNNTAHLKRPVAARRAQHTRGEYPVRRSPRPVNGATARFGLCWTLKSPDFGCPRQACHLHRDELTRLQLWKEMAPVSPWSGALLWPITNLPKTAAVEVTDRDVNHPVGWVVTRH